MYEKKIGIVKKFLPNLNVAIIVLSSKLSIGDNIHFRGKDSDFEEKILDIELNKEKVKIAKGGLEVGIRIKGLVAEGDYCLKVIE